MCYVDDAHSVSSVLATKAEGNRDVMDYHRFLGHTKYTQTSTTTKVMDTTLIGNLLRVFDIEGSTRYIDEVNEKKTQEKSGTYFRRSE